MYAFFFLVSLYVQQVLGYSPLEAGLAFLPFTLGIIVGAGVSQADRAPDPRPPRRAHGRSRSRSSACVILRGAGVDGTYLGNLLPAIIPMSIGMGMTFLPLTLIATTGVSASDAGLASGLFNTSQQVGGALGLAVLSTIAADAHDERARGPRRSCRRRRSGSRRSSRASRSPTWAASGSSSSAPSCCVAVLRTRDMAAIEPPKAQPVAVGA